MYSVAVDKSLVQTASDTAGVACTCQTDLLHWRNSNFVRSKYPQWKHTLTQNVFDKLKAIL
jgi:hypothetical protein